MNLVYVVFEGDPTGSHRNIAYTCILSVTLFWSTHSSLLCDMRMNGEDGGIIHGQALGIVLSLAGSSDYMRQA